MAGVFFVLVAILVGIVTCAVLRYAKNRRYWKLVGKIKGEKTLPLIGNAHQFGTDPESFFKNFVKMFYNQGCTTFKVILGNSVNVVLVDPETVETLLGSTKELEKMEEYRFMKGWLGDGLILTTGNKWRKQRKIITPTFHFKILEQFLHVFHEKGDIFIKKLGHHKGEVFNVYPLVTLFALDVICKSAMGLDMHAQENENSEYIKAVYKVCELINYRTFSPLKRLDFFYWLTNDYRESKKNVAILHDMTDRVIKSRKDAMKEQIEKTMKSESAPLHTDENIYGKQRMAFLDLMLLSKNPEGTPLADESIREETDTFMFAGHDTTSSAISFVLYALANNPDVQAKVFEEQRTISGDDPKREVSHGDIQEMKYLESVIKETLRMYPPVPLFGRRIQNDMTLPDGNVIPADCQVLVHAYSLGRNPKHFTDPEKFDPDRFSAENWRGKHPYLFVPFSAGPRNCLGQKFAMLEIKSIISKVIRSYELLPGGPGTELKLIIEVTLKSNNGFQIKLSERKYK